MLFQRDHFFVGHVSRLRLQLRVDLLDLAGPYQIRTGVIVIQYFHRYNSAAGVVLGHEFLADDIGQPE